MSNNIPTGAAAKSFDLPHLVDNGRDYGWPTVVTRCYLMRHTDYHGFDAETVFTCHRLSDGRLIGAGDTKEEATREAAYRLQRLTPLPGENAGGSETIPEFMARPAIPAPRLF